VHLGRKAAAMIAPDVPRYFPPKSASIMEVFRVTGLLSLQSPLNVNVDMALIFLMASAIAAGPIYINNVRTVIQ
jgi:hypothetical protein